jgi:hypothetical protein
MHAVQIIAALALILVLAKVMGDLFERARQPAVLGEILAGVLIGNLGLVGFDGLSFIATDEVLAFLAELGVIILLFEVGLESNVGQMLRVGASSFLVATVGVIAPMALGYFAARWLLPESSVYVHVFIGAVLTATSVGITARVLGDLGKVQTVEGRIILGAAVIDDVLGLVVLAVVRGIIEGAGRLDAGGILLIIGKSLLFLGGALVIGPWLSRRLFRVAAYLQIRGLLLAMALAFCFALSALAGAIGLAAIVGAFAAGLDPRRGRLQAARRPRAGRPRGAGQADRDLPRPHLLRGHRLQGGPARLRRPGHPGAGRGAHRRRHRRQAGLRPRRRRARPGSAVGRHRHDPARRGRPDLRRRRRGAAPARRDAGHRRPHQRRRRGHGLRHHPHHPTGALMVAAKTSLLVILVGCGGAQPAATPAVDSVVGNPVAMTLPSVDGGEIDLTRYRGRPLVLHVAATASLDAQADVEELRRTRQQRPDIALCEIVFDEGGAALALPWANASGIDWSVALPTAAVRSGQTSLGAHHGRPDDVRRRSPGHAGLALAGRAAPRQAPRRGRRRLAVAVWRT